MLDLLDVSSRLALACIVGGLIGLDRDLKDKPAGLRTFSLVCMGSALLVMAGHGFRDETAIDAVSRVIQGIVTGIGFLGTGLIFRGRVYGETHGLTTAAAIWVTAALGVACGVGAWRTAVVAALLVLAAVHLGGWIEKKIHALVASSSEDSDAGGG